MPRRAAFAVALTATLCAAACGGSRAAAPRRAVTPKRATPVMAVRPSHRLLMVASYHGVVAVDGANGHAVFRAPFGVAAPDASTIVQAQPINTGTRVVASNPRTGKVLWSYDVAGQRRVRVVSQRGAFVALIDGALATASSARPSTTIDVVTRRGARAVTLAGVFDPEAFSVDGRYLFALQFTPATGPTHYSVRRIDLHTNRVEPVPDQNGDARPSMSGYSRTQLMSPDGRRLYTFYASAKPIHEDGETYHAFVHVLDLAKGWAHCIDLDERIGAGESVNPALAVSPDGATLYASDGAAGLTAVVDTKALRSRRVISTPVVSDQLLTALDGSTLFLGDGDTVYRVAVIGRQTQQLDMITVSGTMRALASDPKQGTLYVATDQRMVVLAPDGRAVATWPSPGDANSIDPAVTVPGSGAYPCAC